MAKKKRRPTDATMRNTQSANKRMDAFERRLAMLSRHVLATLKRLEQKIDAVIPDGPDEAIEAPGDTTDTAQEP
jgi:hypothetical protein